jgi:hypothetical protein
MVLVHMTENGNIIFIEVGTSLYNKKDLTKHCKTEYHNKLKKWVWRTMYFGNSPTYVREVFLFKEEM